MSVKAKFQCNSIDNSVYSGGNSRRSVTFSAIYGTAGENADYAKATPDGRISLTLSPDTKAYDLFEPGEDYYVTFEKVEKV